MPGADLVSTPVVTWTDNVDNWRAADADFLQKRSVMRFANVASRTTFLSSAPVAGMISYVNSDDSLQYSDSVSAAANVWRKVLAPKNLATTDVVGSFGMRISTDGSDVFLLQPGKVSLGATQALTVDTAVKVKTGAATATLTTDATALVSDIPIKSPSGTITGAWGVGTLSATSLTSGSIVVSGNTQSVTMNITGAASVAGVLTLATAAVSGLMTMAGSEYMRSSVVGGFQSWYNGATRIGTLGGSTGGLSLSSEVGAATVAGANVVLAASSGPARYGSVSGPVIACSVASPNDPGVTNYPEGTIWLKV